MDRDRDDDEDWQDPEEVAEQGAEQQEEEEEDPLIDENLDVSTCQFLFFSVFPHWWSPP
jgi:hypothetical protein